MVLVLFRNGFNIKNDGIIKPKLIGVPKWKRIYRIR
jgi:hypothetical protein